jgi:hypothetical protein
VSIEGISFIKSNIRGIRASDGSVYAEDIHEVKFVKKVVKTYKFYIIVLNTCDDILGSTEQLTFEVVGRGTLNFPPYFENMATD